MLILGLLLVAATVAFTVLAIAGNMSGGPHYTVSMFDQPIATMNTLAIFASGLALALLFALGLAAMVSAVMHHRHRARAHVGHAGPPPPAA
ncbi:hypothetical protein AB0C59_27945 [Streptomyces sp. NPDC048664]|uniref:hypothetical protein n=1 Tax=Streptomyces sp. NPDC048664 TaxID=3154505 RepID=UPI003412D769